MTEIRKLPPPPDTELGLCELNSLDPHDYIWNVCQNWMSLRSLGYGEPGSVASNRLSTLPAHTQHSSP
jgi:hypothetical protein